MLGHGVEGIVKLAIESRTGKSFAVKIVDKLWLSSSDAWCNGQTLTAEIVIHAGLRHPNIAKFREALQDSDNIYIVMEFCGDGTLATRLEQPLSL